jgi:hypothetical protein
VISDEQVQVALRVWFQDDEFEGGAASIRDMRAALEAAGVAQPPATDEGGWFANGWCSLHRAHGTFFIGRLASTGTFHANRVYADASGKRGLGCDALGYDYATLADAKTAVARRIAELDELSATRVAEVDVQDGQQSEVSL